MIKTIRPIVDRMNYKELCEQAFEGEGLIPEQMLVYTGRKEEEKPVFRVVIPTEPCKVHIGTAGKEYWGIVGYDPETETACWYNYNDCVSLENWQVLERMLKSRFGWMSLLDPALTCKTIERAKNQLTGKEIS